MMNEVYQERLRLAKLAQLDADICYTSARFWANVAEEYRFVRSRAVYEDRCDYAKLMQRTGAEYSLKARRIMGIE